jgi:5,10-methylenetetrahydromethanopterin reductase
MTKIGFAMPAKEVADVSESAAAAGTIGFDSFSVYGDLGDLPAYTGLQIAADHLLESAIPAVGPMGVTPAIEDPLSIAYSALHLDKLLPGRTYIGLVRGALLESIGKKPASLADIEQSVLQIRSLFEKRDRELPPIYLGGFGEKLHELAVNVGARAIKLGGSASVELAKVIKQRINSSDIKLVLGAVSVVDNDRNYARDLARREAAKYIAVVGPHDTTLDEDAKASLLKFCKIYAAGHPYAHRSISDSLLDKFSIAGTPEDAIERIVSMEGVVDRFEIGTPHGIGSRIEAIRFINKTVIAELGAQI